MRIIVFGDIHMALASIERLGPELRTADLAVICGDLTNFGGEIEAACVLDSVRRFAPSVLAVAGNLDHADVAEYLRRAGISIHAEARRFGDLGVFGCGGSNRTPFHTPTEYDEDEIAAFLAAGHAGVADCPRRLMICHTPPHGTATDRIPSGAHVGSPAVRAFIEAHQPDACLTGHIHESAGIDRIGRTTVVNPGAFRDGGYVVATDTDSGINVELKRSA